MDKDRLINLLPEEYLPEPEFKAFPIFAAVLIILTVLLIWFRFQTDNQTLRRLKQNLEAATAANEKKIEQVQEFVDVQANSRFIASYVAVVPNLVLQAPDYWEIYNEVEELLPEDTWVKSISFKGGSGKKWPALVLDCLSRGYSYNGPLNTFDRLKGTSEDVTRFRNIQMKGYRREMFAGGPAVAYIIQMEVKYPID